MTGDYGTEHYVNGPGYPPGPEGDSQRGAEFAEKKAYAARELAYMRFQAAEHAMRQFGNVEDIEAAAQAIAKIAATAMRRRPAK